MRVETGGTPRASLPENLRFNLVQAVPQFLRGPFRERPRIASFLSRHHPDPQGIRAVRRLRERHGEYVWVDVLGKPSLLVLDVDGVRDVLERSPTVYGPPEVKVKGMSHFQPGAVTISTGDEWRERRRFNEEVLASDTRVHPRSAAFLGLALDEVDRMLEGGRNRLAWADFEALFQRLAGGIVFGPDAPGTERVLGHLDHLMAEGNRIFGLSPSDRLESLQTGIRELVCRPGAEGLSPAVCPHVDPDDHFPVAGQVSHWLFALQNTLAVNCANTVALVLTHPSVAERAREEVAGCDLSRAEDVDGMGFLEACLQETMRLLPTTPMLIRRALRDDDLQGHRVEADAQVLIHNGYHHRNPEALERPDHFRPGPAEGRGWSYRFNHLSNGPQACAGRELVLLLGKAVVGRILDAGSWRLRGPRIDHRDGVPHAVDHRRLVLSREPV